MAGAQKGGGSGDTNWAHSQNSSPPNDSSSCDNAVKRGLSTPYRPDRALPSPHNQLRPPSHTYPTILLAYSRCHLASASGSPNHFDRPSSAHDKQSSAAIKPPQGPRLLTALPLSHRVSCGEYGRARSGSRLFIFGTIYFKLRNISLLHFVPTRPILSVQQPLTFHSHLKGTSHEMGRRPRRRI